MTCGHLPLEVSLQQLCAILGSIPHLESQGYKPPIIDGEGYGRSDDPILGIRVFRDAINKEIEILEQVKHNLQVDQSFDLFLGRPDHGSDLSTNASYFIAVWNEILSAPPPLVAIGKVFHTLDGKKKINVAGNAKPCGIKVDIVADEGRKWIRVNTMKNSRILAEFREFDSYLTGSEDDGSGIDEPFNRPTDQDNSLLRMGRALVAASEALVAGTKVRPTVTLRLTRLEPNPSDGDTDPRIAQTIVSLKSMGIDVELGERSFRSLHHPVAVVSDSGLRTQFHPTRRINVDLSMLIALVSDLSHAELPHTQDEAWSRFRMPVNARSWKLGDGHSGPASSQDIGLSHEDEDYSKHSRALSTQCIQEMNHGIVTEVVERLTAFSLPRATIPEFWTTEEARDRCLQIVDKIGGTNEKRRASALFPGSSTMAVSRCQEAFWRGSRYPESYLPYLLPIRIHTSNPRFAPAHITSIFWGHLIQTCRHILSHDATPHPKLYRKNGEMERAKVLKANTKLTVHTVESMLVGTCEGMTTLTANKASVKALLREMKDRRAGCDNGGALEATSAACGVSEDLENAAAAAIWIVEPRSLAECMRADHLQ